MSIKLRFTLLLSLLFAGFLAALLVLRHFESTERREMLAVDRAARVQMLDHWIDATGRELPQFASDLATSPEFAALLALPAPEQIRERILASLHHASLSDFWLVHADGTTRLHASAAETASREVLPVPSDAFAGLVAETPQPRFFVERDGNLLELCARKLQHGRGETWIVVARPWNTETLQTLAQLTESDVSLRPDYERAVPPDDGRLVLLRPLPDWRGQTVRVLRLDYRVPEVELALASDSRQAYLFVAYGLLVLCAMTLAVRGWVLAPLGRIRESLASGDGTPASTLADDRSEFGQLAGLVLNSFAQRDALRHEVAERSRAEAALARSEASLRENLEERARLGRDLHDGVIQSLYAAGMGLAGIRSQLRPDQTEAAARLEQTRGALNETIHDVRNFIVGLEPEALKLQSFSKAVHALMDTMRSMRVFHSNVAIDDEVANRLTLVQRVQALQIAREAVSNALRHGEADDIEIILRRQSEFAEFVIVDDGHGFNPRVSNSPGHGLENFAQRARELGGDLVVDSSPGRGTTVRLMFSLNL